MDNIASEFFDFNLDLKHDGDFFGSSYFDEGADEDDEMNSVDNELLLNSSFDNNLNEGMSHFIRKEQEVEIEEQYPYRKYNDDNNSDSNGLLLDEVRDPNIPTEIVIVKRRRTKRMKRPKILSLLSTEELVKQMEGTHSRLKIFMEKSQQSRIQLDKHGIHLQSAVSQCPGTKVSNTASITQSSSQFKSYVKDVSSMTL
mmetsp:Transcript_2315/g.3552  ORF Transcript_2315/g.3552 Transcript_2315/m.3552 type:complete len:199 (-) Transcript_2315:21-617(-)